MKPKPIIFSPAMVRAIKRGDKIQTRQISNKYNYKCGDIIWVKEDYIDFGYWICNWEGEKIKWHSECQDGIRKPLYVADDPHYIVDGDKSRLIPAVYMPFKFARLFLEITDIKQERLQDISEHDLKLEGIDYMREDLKLDDSVSDREVFKTYWNKLHKDENHKWESNPQVWVINFMLYEKRMIDNEVEEKKGIDLASLKCIFCDNRLTYNRIITSELDCKLFKKSQIAHIFEHDTDIPDKIKSLIDNEDFIGFYDNYKSMFLKLEKDKEEYCWVCEHCTKKIIDILDINLKKE